MIQNAFKLAELGSIEEAKELIFNSNDLTDMQKIIYIAQAIGVYKAHHKSDFIIEASGREFVGV